MRILIVEDDVDACTATQRYLAHYGFDVRAAQNPQEAYRLAAQCPPDVLICDWNLCAVEDGVDVARRVQEQTNAVVVFVTGQSICALRRACHGVDVASIFQKPLELAALKTTLETIARSRRT